VFKIEKEPIFDSILLNMVLGNSVNLKKKARIKVKDACVLMGVIDERGILVEGEVFVRIQRQSFAIEEAIEEYASELSSEKKAEYEQMVGTATKFPVETLTGHVMVTKNPCSHPGDIRLLRTISETDARFEQLRDFINVIVFPRKGYRPEQHKMSGGDLDGDCFMVMWDKEIVGALNPDMIKPPAVYLKYEDDSKLKSNRIEDHIKRYFEKDNLGHIANIHLALCDQIGPEGPYTDECIELSRL
jgi:RNA-dependent RNA polymerase